MSSPSSLLPSCGGCLRCRPSCRSCRRTWNAVRGWAEQWHIREILDSTPRMLERYYTFYNLFDDMRNRHVSQLWAHDCYFGVISILLNAIPAVEFEEGLPLAQEMFMQAKYLLAQENNTARVNWTMPLEPSPHLMHSNDVLPWMRQSEHLI